MLSNLKFQQTYFLVFIICLNFMTQIKAKCMQCFPVLYLGIYFRKLATKSAES